MYFPLLPIQSMKSQAASSHTFESYMQSANRHLAGATYPLTVRQADPARQTVSKGWLPIPYKDIQVYVYAPMAC